MAPQARNLAALEKVGVCQAIVQANDGKYGVFVISKSGAGDIASLHSVEIGAVNGTDVVVVSGLSAGERIITAGANLLKDGQRVEVVQ